MDTDNGYIGGLKDRPELTALINAAKGHVMTPGERRAQAISFIYGQMMDSSSNVTKEEVARVYDETHGFIGGGLLGGIEVWRD